MQEKPSSTKNEGHPGPPRYLLRAEALLCLRNSLTIDSGSVSLSRGCSLKYPSLIFHTSLTRSALLVLAAGYASTAILTVSSTVSLRGLNEQIALWVLSLST